MMSASAVTDEEHRSTSPVLPQPSKVQSISYRYVLGDHIDSLFFQNNKNEFTVDQLVWVCKSKGRRKKRGHKKNESNETGENATKDQLLNDDFTVNRQHQTSSIVSNDHQHQRHELFLRARVVDPHAVLQQQDGYSNRVRVRYPAGSTYCVQPQHLVSVLERQQHLVLVWPETDTYRRCCSIHTVPGQDNFLEIGSDEGETIYKVYEKLPEKSDNENNDGLKRTFVIGLDKSEYSVKEARRRYPKCQFELCDVLKENPNEWPLPNEFGVSSWVAAIDINGNRELPAVLKCMQVVINMDNPPRLIIVKSRALYSQLSGQKPRRKIANSVNDEPLIQV